MSLTATISVGDACDDETLDEGIGGSLSTFASKVESTPRERPGEMMQRSKSTIQDPSPSSSKVDITTDAT